MSRISMLNIAAERQRAVCAHEAVLERMPQGHGRSLSLGVLNEYIACLDDALRECQGEAMPAAVSAERRRELRVTVNSLVTDDSDRIDLHRAINAWMAPPKALNLESRLDLAAQWVADLRIDAVADCRAMASEPFLRWAATVTPDRIGNARQTFVRYADSPAGALSLALTDAAEWVKKAKDVR